MADPAALGLTNRRLQPAGGGRRSSHTESWDRICDALSRRRLLNYVEYRIRATRIAATRLARNLDDVVGRIRYRGESFSIERNGVLVARVGPVTPEKPPQLRELIEAWTSVDADPELARHL